MKELLVRSIEARRSFSLLSEAINMSSEKGMSDGAEDLLTNSDDVFGSAGPLNGELDNIFDDDDDDGVANITSSDVTSGGRLGAIEESPRSDSFGGDLDLMKQTLSSPGGVQHTLSEMIGSTNSANTVTSSLNGIAPQQGTRDSIASVLSAASALPVPSNSDLVGSSSNSGLSVTSSALPVTSSAIPVTSSAIPVTSSAIPVTSSAIPVTSNSDLVRSSSISSTNSTSRADELAGGWQNYENDEKSRKEMILQIARLLRERKSDPSVKWLRELPYKAKKLEEQLYKNASSLEAYLDRTTLKSRLKKIAHAITSQFKGARKASGSNSAARRNQVRLPPPDENLSFGTLPGANSTPTNPGGNSVSMPDLSALEQQQQQLAVNQKLQEQILVNLRQQKQIMSNLAMQTSNPHQGVTNATFPQAVDPTSMNISQLNIVLNANQPANMNAQNTTMQTPFTAQVNQVNTALLQNMATRNSNAANSMAMMNSNLLRNNFPNLNGAPFNSLQVGAMNQQTLAGPPNMAGSIPPPPLTHPNSGVNQAMPTPLAVPVRRSSSAKRDSVNQTSSNEDSTLSPTTFQW